ncbi:DUF1183-domain-containing protein [Schizopora paradoxa]|uniref:Store-operated calcium entry-associated regulatory factor n=1 Tax=Schizopora paradoxa TaxID=27342 RepID=A0A0H2SDX6_9AGAM|nr:DUF1183-domain-containing protein [Schizopora paradoxa]
MSRVLLADIQRLTLHKGAKTKGRRSHPIPQLKCVGECRNFEPEVVRCHNVGGEGTEIDWTCEADLPEKLRFGRIDVSCEGWSGPGDPYVTKGSCGLTYQLVRIRGPGEANHQSNSDFVAHMFFATLTFAIVLFILYGIFRNCRAQNQRRTSPNGPRPNNRPGSSYPGGGPGWNDSPPPPYSDSDFKRDNFRPSSSSNSDFARGAALGAVGGAAALAAAQAVHRQWYNPEYRSYDWEHREQSPPTMRNRNSDRGEGSSNLGELRASTGFGTSSVR